MIRKHGRMNGKQNHTYINCKSLTLSIFIRPSYSTHGLISGSGVGQSEFLWNVRSNRQVKKVYAHIWNNQ